MKEEWKDVVGYEEYFQVSDHGNVRSKRTNKILKQHKRKNGYKTIATKIGGRNGTALCFKVHRLVAEAFLEPPSKEMIDYCTKQGYGVVLVCHKNDIKDDNCKNNLKWGTSKDNSEDAIRNGCIPESTEMTHSKLSKEEIMFIRNNYKYRDKEFGCKALGERYGIHKSNISRALNKISYKI